MLHPRLHMSLWLLAQPRRHMDPSFTDRSRQVEAIPGARAAGAATGVTEASKEEALPERARLAARPRACSSRSRASRPQEAGAVVER